MNAHTVVCGISATLAKYLDPILPLCQIDVNLAVLWYTPW